MHTKPVSEHEGELSASEPSDLQCRECGHAMRYQVWRSSCGGYEDEKHSCTWCSAVVWIDGIDS